MFPSLGLPEMVMIMMLAVLLFGKRLPEVGRSLGKGLVEFKKGLRGFEDNLDISSHTAPSRFDDRRESDHVETIVPKFEPPTSAPVPQPQPMSEPQPQPYQD
jgi:sec-independent protein translocase protein TatA